MIQGSIKDSQNQEKNHNKLVYLSLYLEASTRRTGHRCDPLPMQRTTLSDLK